MTQLRGIPLWLEQGKLRQVDGDVLGIVQQVQAISDRLAVYHDEWDDGFTITEHCLDGTERLVLRAEALDQRVIDRLHQADHWHGQEQPTHVLADDLDAFTRMDEDNEAMLKEQDYQGMQKVLEAGEQLGYYLEEDGHGTKAHIHVPRHYGSRETRRYHG